jgi:hypothetical protein
MHFKPKGVVGIAVPVLIGGALAAGALALPAHAASYSDTALSATAVTDATWGGSGTPSAANGTHVILLSPTNVTWKINGTAPTDVSVAGNTITYTGTSTGTVSFVADGADSAGNAEALEISATLGDGSIQTNSAGTPVALSHLAESTSSPTVTFVADSSAGSDTINFAESQLPTGLTSGNPTLTYVGGTAAPGTYTGVEVTATDSNGAVLHGTFTLTVDATTVTNSGTTGDEVNKFDYGFDSYRQHDYAGAIVVGWTASSSDPATQFLMNSGSHSGYVQFEYAPTGSGSGLCVSDPGGGWGSDPLRDGLILANCNSGPFQQFFQESDGTLVNLATGLIIDPAGKGGQLRGGSSAVGWGGSSYTWESGE